MAALRRLRKELDELNRKPLPFCSVNIVNDNLRQWRVTISGPPDTPYDGGVFHLVINFPKEYPFRAPELIFETKILHPNINIKGDVCCCCLQTGTYDWKPKTMIADILNNLFNALRQPDISCHLGDTMGIYVSEKEKYNKLARIWTQQVIKAASIRLIVGDEVQIIENGEILTMVELESDLNEVAGKIGKITEILSNGDLKIDVDGRICTLNQVIVYPVSKTTAEWASNLNPTNEILVPETSTECASNLNPTNEILVPETSTECASNLNPTNEILISETSTECESILNSKVFTKSISTATDFQNEVHAISPISRSSAELESILSLRDNISVSEISMTSKGTMTDFHEEHHSSQSFVALNKKLKRNALENILTGFLENNQGTDIVFKVKCQDDHIRIPCHKLVLSLWSPVFSGIFFGENRMGSNEIEISDISAPIFEALIKYCYGSKTELQKNCHDVNFLVDILKAAKRYEIESLSLTYSKIFDLVTPTKDNVFKLLDVAALINSECLKLRCYKVLQCNTAEILSSRDMSSISPNIISTVLDMPVLSLNSEYDLLTWLFDWGSYKSREPGNSKTFKEIMNPYLLRLNFLSLKAEEFALLAKKHKNFFTEKEGFSILMNIACAESCDLPPWCNATKLPRSFDSGNEPHT